MSCPANQVAICNWFRAFSRLGISNEVLKDQIFNNLKSATILNLCGPFFKFRKTGLSYIGLITGFNIYIFTKPLSLALRNFHFSNDIIFRFSLNSGEFCFKSTLIGATREMLPWACSSAKAFFLVNSSSNSSTLWFPERWTHSLTLR